LPHTVSGVLGDNFVLPRRLSNNVLHGDKPSMRGALFVYQSMHGRVLPRLIRPEVRAAHG
jgi:hypothetical protein